MTENTSDTSQTTTCNYECGNCCKKNGMGKHCIWGGIGIALALLFSVVALIVSLCGGHHDRGWHDGHDGPPMMQQRFHEDDNWSGRGMMAPDAPVPGDAGPKGQN